MLTTLQTNLQKWTPFAVLVILISVACIFIIVWDTVYMIQYPYYVVALLTLMLGGTGASSLIHAGTQNATSVAVQTAAATANGNTPPSLKAIQANTEATEANTAATKENTK